MVSLAYDAAHWGNDLAPLALDSRSAPYPHGSLGWVKGDCMQVAATAARLVGTELSASVGTGQSYRQTDVVWATWRGHLGDLLDLGLLGGSHRDRPWLQEPDSAAQFRWSNWASLLASVQSANGVNKWTAEWVPNVASTLSWSSRYGAWRGTFNLARVQTQNAEDVLPRHAGTPLGSPLLPLWRDETTWEPLAIWRSEGAVTWKRGRMRAGVHMLALADQWWLEAWGRGPCSLSGLCTSPQVSKRGNSKATQTCRAKAFVGELGEPYFGDVSGNAYLCATMLSLILTCLLAFCATLVGMPSLIAVAKRKHLVDEPTEARKIHHRSVPTIGGLMVFAALMSSSLVSFAIQQPPSNQIYVWVGILGAAMLVFFMGLKDDIMVMSASRKLFVHMAVGAYLVGALDLRIDNFGGLFGLEHIPFWVSAPFSWFVYIVVVNAVNLIDGLDGLIGGFGTLVMTAFGVWFFQTGDLASAIVAFSTAGALLGFLVFNFNPARIFMGDGGSLLLGLIVYAMAIRVMQTPAEAALDGLVQPVAAMCMPRLPPGGHPQGVHLAGAGRSLSVLA